MDAFYMSETTKAVVRRPTKDYGEAISDLAIKEFKTNAAVIKAAGYDGSDKNENLRLLKKGKGSDRFARSLEDALRKRGVNISTLPPMFPDDETKAADDWRREWIWIGEMLHEYAREIYDRQLNGLRGDDGLRTLARGLARAAGQEIEISRANVAP
jgi:hypothetical protein